MRRRIAAGVAVVGLGLGAFGASPAVADPTDKLAKDFAHDFCADPAAQELIAAQYGV